MNPDRNLQAVPDPPGSESGGRGGGGDSFESRISRLETHFKYLATKEDLQKLKVWWLIGIISGMGAAAAIAAAIAVTILKFFS